MIVKRLRKGSGNELIQIVKSKKIALMVWNKEKESWHCFAVKMLSVLLRGKTLKNDLLLELSSFSYNRK